MKIKEDMKAGIIHKTKSFGDVQIIEYFDSSNVLIVFLNTGYIAKIPAGSIRKGCVRDPLSPRIYGVGFIGNGIHKSKCNGGPSKCYEKWYSMMSRCYSITVQKRQPQYIGVTVCDEWHNFQNFAGWYYRRLMSIQHVAALDKDILSGDVKVYSPETCKLVTHRDNQEKAKAKYWMFKGPDGDDIEIYNLSKFCEENNLNSANMSKVHSMDRMSHKGWRKA